MNSEPGSVESRYDVFLSYSHEADSGTALELQQALRRIAKPWYRLEGMRVFRDETDLSVTPEGWESIEKALAGSRYYLLLASRQAAASSWVLRELAYWLENRGPDTLLIALTDGDIVWDDSIHGFDWDRTPSLPREIDGAFQSEPFWADLRWADEKTALRLSDARFQSVVAKLAAPVRELDVATLIGEHHRQHRRTLRFATGAAGVLAVSLVTALWQFQSSVAAAEREQDQHVLALVARAYQSMYQDPLLALDEASSALAIEESVQAEQALALARSVAAGRRASRLRERSVLGSGEGYLMERWRQGDVFTRLREDGSYALVASERGKDGPDPPGTVYLIQLDNLQTVQLEPGDSAQGRRLEYMGFSRSGERIFVARQFYLDIYDLQGALTDSVQLEFHAKPTHLIAGMFAGHVLVGDTVGHLMLADTASESRPQLEGSRHGDPAVLIESAPSGESAIVIYESGKADLLVLDDIDSPREYELTDAGTIHASFGPPIASGRFLTCSGTGDVIVWSLGIGGPERLLSIRHGEVAVDLASISRDGQRVISQGDDGSFRLWDIESGRLLSEQ